MINNLNSERMNELIKKVYSTHDKYTNACEKLESSIRQICDFNARLTWCAGDGHLVLNEETSSVATLSCLNGKTTTNKLTEDEHIKYCI